MRKYNKQYQIILDLSLYFFIMLLVFSCKTISVQNKQHIQTTRNMTLGSVGIDENFIIEKTYTSIGTPNYFKPIKVNVLPVSFNNASYSGFMAANLSQRKDIKINYHDSLDTKPSFLSLEIADKITLIELLNHKENLEIKNFMLNDNNTHLITGISIVFDSEIYNILVDAQEVFIEGSGINNIVLKTYKDSKHEKTIYFNQGVVFSYRSAFICWRENSKYQLEIAGLAEADNGCSKLSYKSSKRAKKDINYYKF